MARQSLNALLDAGRLARQPNQDPFFFARQRQQQSRQVQDAADAVLAPQRTPLPTDGVALPERSDRTAAQVERDIRGEERQRDRMQRAQASQYQGARSGTPLRERLAGAENALLSGLGMADAPIRPLAGGDLGVGLLDLLPGTGEALAINDYNVAKANNDLAGVVLSAVGATPIIGDLSKGASAVADSARAVRRVPRADSESMRGYRNVVEDVPLDMVPPGNALRGDDSYINDLAASMQTEGLSEPVILTVGKNSRTAMVGEGNHRIEAARRAGFTHIPARTIVGSEYGAGLPQRDDLIPQPGEYFPSDAAPSRVFAQDDTLPGAPRVEGATGPDPRLVSTAQRYADKHGIDWAPQSEYVGLDEDRARRIAEAYDAMEHNPTDPRVRQAYDDLIQQTLAQLEALEGAGYNFRFFDPKNDPYAGNPWNAMRDLRQNQRMDVYPTSDGFGTLSSIDDNPLLRGIGREWEVGTTGQRLPVTANDAFRAVHDSFGHGLEGAGFRARGEENAWQAHRGLFTGDAIGALTSETRGQNSWLNYGPYGDANRTARVEDTVFADQKTGLMDDWTWNEGVAPTNLQRLMSRILPGAAPVALAGGAGAVALEDGELSPEDAALAVFAVPAAARGGRGWKLGQRTGEFVDAVHTAPTRWPAAVLARNDQTGEIVRFDGKRLGPDSVLRPTIPAGFTVVDEAPLGAVNEAKIGTPAGEGATAYGAGHYNATADPVREYYFHSFGSWGGEPFVRGYGQVGRGEIDEVKMARDFETTPAAVEDAMMSLKGLDPTSKTDLAKVLIDRQALRGRQEQHLAAIMNPSHPKHSPEAIRRMREEIEHSKGVIRIISQLGHEGAFELAHPNTYLTRLHGDMDNAWFDWDKPINQQSGKIQGAFEELLSGPGGQPQAMFEAAAAGMADGARLNDPRIIAAFQGVLQLPVEDRRVAIAQLFRNGRDFLPRLSPETFDLMKRAVFQAYRPDMTGGTAYNRVTGLNETASNLARVRSDDARSLEGQKLATQQLRGLGIEGTHYLDGVSRADSPRKSSNYNAFVPGLVEIVERIGIGDLRKAIREGRFSPSVMALIGAGAAGGLAMEDGEINEDDAALAMLGVPAAARRGALKGASDPNIISTARPGPRDIPRLGDPNNVLIQQGLELMRQFPDAFAKNMEQIRGLPMMARSKAVTPDQVAEDFVQRGADNIKFVADQMSPEKVEASAGWYGTANNIASSQEGLPTVGGAAALAATSPQTPWPINVARFERLMQHIRGGLDPQSSEEASAMTAAYQRRAQRGGMYSQIPPEVIDQIIQTPFEQLDPSMRLAKLVLLDDVRNSPDVPDILPSGERVGRYGSMTWGTSPELNRALAAIQNPSIQTVEDTFPGSGKIDSFYNNIVAPNAPDGGVTGDTHAIGAANLMPYGANDVPVLRGMGRGGAASPGGSAGHYGAYVDAYRRAADEMGVLPHQAQSIPWEGVRELWGGKAKTEQLKAAVETIWRTARNDQEARREISRLMESIRASR